MSTPAARSRRATFAITGAVAFTAGILITIWPKSSALVLVAILGIYFIASGLAYAASGIFSKGIAGSVRASEIIFGALFLLGGVIVLANPSDTAVALGVFVGIFVGIAWIVEGVVALMQANKSGSKSWAMAFSILSASAGVLLLFSPMWGTMALFSITGLSLIVLGTIQIVRSFMMKREPAAN
ncbi:MAG: HdeD family acid-resistance protein [Thermomicrobiales bacterium]